MEPLETLRTKRYWMAKRALLDIPIVDGALSPETFTQVVLYTDAQATIAALEETILKMGENAAVVAKDAMAAKEQVAALPVAVDVYTHKEGRVILAALQNVVNEMIVCYTDDTAKPIAALLTYRATLKGGDGE